ncbi:11225_t:CDS:2, partial [Dentiscutata erythropus]
DGKLMKWNLRNNSTPEEIIIQSDEEGDEVIEKFFINVACGENHCLALTRDGEVFSWGSGSVRCDCGEQLKEAMELIRSEGRGVVIYLRQEGRGIGLADKLRAYNLQDLGYDTVSANVFLHHPPDLRTYDIANQILADLRLSNIRLLTNNPDKIEQVENGGIKVVERVPMVPLAWKVNHDSNHIINELDQYLKVKVERMRHLLNVPETLLN